MIKKLIKKKLIQLENEHKNLFRKLITHPNNTLMFASINANMALCNFKIELLKALI